MWTWNRSVLNTAYGKTEELPFDIRGRLTLTYAAAEQNSDLKSVRQELQKDFAKALRPVLAKPFSHYGTVSFLDDSLALRVTVPKPHDGHPPEFEKRVVVLPLALKGAPDRTLTNIDCHLDFPSGFKPKDKRGLKFEKRCDESPTADALMEAMFPPRSKNPMADLFDELASDLGMQRPLCGMKPEHTSPESATVEIDGQQVRVHIKKLKANLVHVFPEIYMIIDPAKAAFPAIIRSRLSTDAGESIADLTLQEESKETETRCTTTESDATSG
jgi:hypothetical protein